MSPSLPARLTRYAPSIRRAHEQYASGAATRSAMLALRTGPPTYAPPRWVGLRTTLVEGITPDGWPVFSVSPRSGRSVGRVVFLHGGAYFRELRPPHWRLAARLARAGFSVLVPIYPLAPAGVASSVVPAVVELVRDVLRYPEGPVFLVGDSAGAGMALAVAAALREAGERALAGLVLVSPWVDVSCADPGVAARAPLDPWLQVAGLREAGDAYRAELPAEHPWVSPIFGPLTGLGPMLVMSGTDDILNPDAHRLVDALRSSGEPVDFVEAPGLIHDYALHRTPEGRAARGRIVRWMQARTGREESSAR